MPKADQKLTPFVDALKDYTSEDVVPFDVPGHHMGNIDNAATALFGHEVYRCDVNAPIGMDNLAKPTGVILKSERLLAKACGADEGFFLINGTSSGIIAMIITAVKANEKILLPRNVHKSIVNALILSGAIPVYVMPEIDNDLEIANQPSLQDWKKAILRNPSAKAVFVINPTYFGSVGPLQDIVAFAHERHMAVLCDEAHGAHYYFKNKHCPLSAMAAGADMSAASFHKTVGSLTQSSVLLMHTGLFTRADVQKSLNIINTTSPSPILIASLDAARSFMASPEGTKAMGRTYDLAAYARKEIDKIPGFINEGKTHFLAHGSYDYDESKLVIGLDHLDIDGFQLYHLLKEKYLIQMELAETYAILAILAIGTKKEHIDRLVSALREISQAHYHADLAYADHHFDNSFPYMLIRPRAAFHAPGKVVPLNACDGAISKEQIMIYPPGIPIIVPGEVWTKELVSRVKHYASNGVTILSSYHNGCEVVDTERWKRFPVYEKKLKDYYENRKTTPSADGYHVPFEGLAHQATFVLIPFRADTWRQKAIPAQEAFLDVIKAIAAHEKVLVGVHPALYKRLAPVYEAIPNVSALSIRYNDSWARDSMPLFVTNGKSIRAVDFRFNAWGGEFDGLYRNYRDDDKISTIVAKRLKMLDYRLPNFVLEGGSVAVDGQGTLITTEACLLSKGRNPTMSKTEIEEVLRDYLGVEKVIWVPHGIYGDETDEHIDNMVAFARPGVVVLAWTEDKNDPQYEYCQSTYAALKEATDAKGHKLRIHKILVPSPALCMSAEECRGLINNASTRDRRKEGRRLAASYVNFYQGADFVILPQFGVPEDKMALREMRKLFPTKTIHPIDTREILLGGGNIHCITMQLPCKEE
ncbi:MAG: agmatine deiminase [Bacilli bacterium]|jgi:lysine decarboxylase|nr:agmatine deiminase [Bacilli bacterium]